MEQSEERVLEQPVNENYKKTEMEQNMEQGEQFMEHNLEQSAEQGLEQPVSGYYMKTEIE